MMTQKPQQKHVPGERLDSSHFFVARSRSESIYGKRSWIQFSGHDGCMSIYLKFVCVFFLGGGWGGVWGKIVSFCFLLLILFVL